MTTAWAAYLMLLGATPVIVAVVEAYDAAKKCIVWFKGRGKHHAIHY